MKARRPSLTRLLAAARQDRADLTLSDFRAEEVRWALTAGLGPWLRRCTAGDPRAAASPLWPLVQGADLTARVIVAEQMDAVEEIVDICERHAPALTLLKGISVSEQYYPEPHLRIMGDIDILVDGHALSTVQSRLARLGYRPRSDYPLEFYETHHHTMPLFHPARRVWVEIHRGLFPPTSRVGSDGIFSPDNVRAELQPSMFRGHRVNRLSDELQLVYLASHWAFGFKRERAMVGMLDVIHLLKSASRLRWVWILDRLEGSRASTYLYLLLTYLVRHRLADLESDILRELFRRQPSFGRLNLRAVHAVIDRYVVDGRDFGALMSERNFGILWETLLSAGRPSRNLLVLLWTLLPSRARLTQLMTRHG